MAQIDLARIRVAGSAEEVQEIGLDPKRIYSCGPERPGVAGCPIYSTCQRPEKDKTGFVRWERAGATVAVPRVTDDAEGLVRDGPGPLSLGLQMWRRQGETRFKVVTRTCKCWELPQIKANWQAINTGSEIRAGCKVIAIEGQLINLAGSKPEVQEDARVIHVIQQGGIPTLIRPIQRPRENPAFAQSAMAIAEIEREKKQFDNADLKTFVKLTPGEHSGGLELDDDDDAAAAGPNATKGGASSRG